MKELILRIVDLVLFWFDVVLGSVKGCWGLGFGDLVGDVVN